MPDKPLPTPEDLHKILRYEPETGKLFWRKRPLRFFHDTEKRLAKHTQATWNTRFAGKQAIISCHLGYYRGSIFGSFFLAHRIIWAMVHGKWPEDQIDHINHDGTDNRIINLRVVEGRENSKNQSMRPDNKSGFTGVIWGKTNSKWYAYISNNGRRIYLGGFDIKSDAIEARIKANTKYFYHENHGNKLV